MQKEHASKNENRLPREHVARVFSEPAANLPGARYVFSNRRALRLLGRLLVECSYSSVPTSNWGTKSKKALHKRITVPSFDLVLLYKMALINNML